MAGFEDKVLTREDVEKAIAALETAKVRGPHWICTPRYEGPVNGMKLSGEDLKALINGEPFKYECEIPSTQSTMPFKCPEKLTGEFK